MSTIGKGEKYMIAIAIVGVVITSLALLTDFITLFFQDTQALKPSDVKPDQLIQNQIINQTTEGKYSPAINNVTGDIDINVQNR